MGQLTVGIVQCDEDAQQCFRLRYEANVADGKRSSFLAHESKRVRDVLDDVATIHYVKDGETVVGTIRSVWGRKSIPKSYREWFGLHLFPELKPEEIGFSSRLIIHRDYRKSRALPLLLDSNYVDGRKKGMLVDFMHASPSLISMYERLGYHCYVPGVVPTDVGCHVPMLLTADATEWLRGIGSPFYRSAKAWRDNPLRRGWINSKFPGYVDGMSAVLRGENQFSRLLDMAHPGVKKKITVKLHSAALASGAIVRARAGDVVARSVDGFSDAIIQLDGESVLRDQAGSAVYVASGLRVIDQYLSRPSDRDYDLYSSADSTYVVVSAYSWRESEQRALPTH